MIKIAPVIKRWFTQLWTPYFGTIKWYRITTKREAKAAKSRMWLRSCWVIGRNQARLVTPMMPIQNTDSIDLADLIRKSSIRLWLMFKANIALCAKTAITLSKLKHFTLIFAISINENPVRLYREWLCIFAKLCRQWMDENDSSTMVTRCVWLRFTFSKFCVIILTTNPRE